MPERITQLTREVAGHLFVANVRAAVCSACGEPHFAPSVVHQFELHVADKLAEAGEVSGDALRFMRKTLGLQANAFADMLGVAPETVSRWEGEKRAANRSAAAILCAMVREAAERRSTTRDALLRLQSPHPLGARVQIDLESAAARAGSRERS